MTGPAGLLAAADLDGTLIYSLAAAGVASPAVTVVEHLGGVPSAVVARAAVADLDALAQAGVLVPATTRSVEQYRRVRLPGPPPAWVCAANGGVLLHDGVFQPWWEARVRSQLADAVSVTAVLERLQPLAERPWVRVVRTVGELFTYLVATDRSAVELDEVDHLRVWAADRGLTVSLQGRKIYVVPAALTKQAAVAAVVERTESPGFVAAGDSLLDAGLLAAADAGIRPGHGELHAAGWQRSNVCVSTAPGVAAGAEIAAWLRRLTVPDGLS